jgi:hypothetical protein
MMRQRSIVLASLAAAMLGGGAVFAGEPAAQPAPQLVIGFRNTPDPPRSGPNSMEVTLKRTDGTAVSDAQVTVVYFMPAMPSMSMPAMKISVTLQPAGPGVYRGSGSLVMAGTWNVTITAARAGKPLGSRKLSVIAR